MPLSMAVEEDDLLIEAASWVEYYDKANKHIQEIVNAKIAERPSQELIDNPDRFKEWLGQCEQLAMRRQE